ncbi:MAG TPA: MFS transporter [Acidimicrobiales bacterium]|nr:MFS transporter [Acidimicrobiales bacterium]
MRSADQEPGGGAGPPGTVQLVYGEEADEAQIEGDVPYAPGSARAALAHRSFRYVWAGALASNVGTWMQNVALGVLAYQLSHSAGYVAILGFAQLGPLLVLAMVGGALADVVNRKVLLVACQAEQLVFSLLLAWAAHAHHPSKTLIFWCVLAIGIGNALNAPTFSAILPLLVGRRDLAGAVSLQSVQVNVSRVVGPAIGGLVLPTIAASGVFVVNAATYLFAIGTLATVTLPRPDRSTGESGLRRLAGGLAVARRDPLVRQCLMTIFTMSLFCLPFIGLMPVLAARDLHISPDGAGYGGLYALFGVGAAVGAVSVGTFLLGVPRPRVVRLGLVGFALSLAAFGLLRSAIPAYPVALLVGFTYFATVTALSTTLQEHISDNVRGRVMALWIMAFGGTIPLGLLAGGAVATRTSIGTVVTGGAVIAAVLAAVTRLGPRPGRRSRQR